MTGGNGLGLEVSLGPGNGELQMEEAAVSYTEMKGVRGHRNDGRVGPEEKSKDRVGIWSLSRG